MSNPLAGMIIDKWYKGWIAASLAILVASLVARDTNASIIATASLIFGFGEWVNHPTRRYISGDMEIADQSRRPSVMGIIMNIAGVGIAALGIWRAFK